MSDNGATVIIPRSRVAPGTTLNGIYRIDHPIAAGGMGEIYKGYAIQTGDAVAIKMIRSDLAENESALALFRKEASSLHNLQHEAIVRYYLFSIDPQLGRAYLAMEFVDGTSLKDHLVRGPLSFEDTQILQQRIASGLHSAHKLGIIHRDVAPDNVILPGADVGAAKILDFGIARSTKAGEQTIIGSGFAGKYNYVSPEQLGLFGGDVTPKSDIYSFGLVLAECLQGRPIDMNGSQVEVIDKRRVVPDLSAIDPRFRPLLDKMLQPLPENRPATMAEVAAWLPAVGKTARSRKPVEAGSESQSGGKAGMAIAAGLGALALLGGGLFFGTNLMRGGEQVQVAAAGPASLANEEAQAAQAAGRAAEEARTRQDRERETQLAAQAEASRLAEAQRVEQENRRIAEARAADEARRQAEARAADEARRIAEAREAEERRVAAEARAAEEARRQAEARAAEERRIAAEARAAEDARKLAEAKTQEEVRRLTEAKAAEDRRLAAEARAAEEARKIADAKAAEEARRQAEARAAEERRIAAEARAAEEARKIAEAKAAEDARKQALAKAADERRLAAEAKAAEEARKVAEAKAEEEARRLAQQAKLAEERRLAAEAKAAEEARKLAEAKAAEESRRQALARAAEERRLAAEAKAAEDARKLAEAKAAEDERVRVAAAQAEDARRVEEARLQEETKARQSIDAAAAGTRAVTDETQLSERQRLAQDQAYARFQIEQDEALRRAGVRAARPSSDAPETQPEAGQTAGTQIAAVDPGLLESRGLPDKAAPDPRPVPTDRVALTRETQQELKRIGCYSGPISGAINVATREALRVFRLNAKLQAEPASVSPEQLLDLRGRPEEVCEPPKAAPQRPAIVRRPPQQREAPAARRAQQPTQPRQAVSRPAPAAPAPAAAPAAPRRVSPSIGLGF
jgi:hypothetical protein